MSIQVLNYQVEDLGWLMKQSKKKCQWTFMLDNNKHILELEFSILSGKRKLVLDGRVLHESMMLTSQFQYPFTLDGFALSILQQGDTFELRINNKDFSHLYNQIKTNAAFQNEDNKPYENPSFESHNFDFENHPKYIINSSSFIRKMSLNFKFENPKDVSPIYQKASTTQQIKTSTAFGQPGAFEEFEQFGKVQKTENPFGDSFQVSGFTSADTPQTVQKQAKIDLLDIDDDTPQKSQTVDVDPFQQQQNSQQTQQTGLFDAFGTGWNQQQPQQGQQNLLQESNKSSQPFDAFNLVGSVGQIGSVPAQQGFSNQQGGFQSFDQRFPEPQKQEQLKILNLYRNQQPVVGNLAYSAFPQVYTQPMVQQQPTPFDLFR